MSELSANHSDRPASPARSNCPVQRAWPLARWAHAALAVLVSAAFLAFCYRLALARVPQYRANLESLARARTGLDLHFNELGVRWGWYGPEAVFRDVELGEPGASSVLLRASELIVGLDLWRTLQSGRLQAGRMTLITPDIDAARFTTQRTATAQRGAPRAAEWDPALLEKWPEGRLDVEGGTLTLPDAQSPTRTARLLLRRATLRHGVGLWSATVQTLLPERLGSAASFSLQLSDERAQHRGLAMRVHFRGQGVHFAGWHGLLESQWPAARLPAAGTGDIDIALSLNDGHLSDASGQLRAEEVGWRRAAPGAPSEELRVGHVQGEWHLLRAAGAWHLRAHDLILGTSGYAAPRAVLSVDVRDDTGAVSGEISDGPLQLLLAAAPCVVPGLEMPDPSALRGTLAHLTFHWNARTSGARLELAGHSEDLQLALPGTTLKLAGLHARLAGTERDLGMDLEASAARLSSAAARRVLDGVQVSAHLHLMRLGNGWQLAADHVALEHAAGALSLNGTVRIRPEGQPSSLLLHVMLAHADAAALSDLLRESLPQSFAAQAARVRSGRIPHAELDWAGALGAPPAAARLFSGSLALEDGSMDGVGGWPDMQQLWGRIAWRGDQFRAEIERGRGGPFRIEALSASWRLERPESARLAGQAHTRLEDAVAWLRAHPEFDGFASAVRDLDVRGPATVSFNLDAPAVNATSTAARLRVLTQLDADVVRLAAPLPVLQSLSGVLAIDSGHLQRSVLHGSWLGGTLALRISERREAHASALSIQAQGTLDSRELMRTLGVDTGTGTASVAGRTSWSGELICPLLAAHALHDAGTWSAQLDSSLTGVSSSLPVPLAKTASALAPVHLDLRGTSDTTRLQLRLGSKVFGILDLERAGGGWRPSGGLLALGESPGESVPQRLFSLTGYLDRLDLPRWMLAWRRLAATPQVLPLSADLEVGALALAGESYSDVDLTLTPDDQGSVLRLESDGLAGSVRWPANAGQGSVEAHLRSVSLAENSDPSAGLALLASLGPEADLSADRIVWRGRSLGSLSAHLRAVGDRLTIDPIALSNANEDLGATVRCESIGPCRVRLELSSRDAAASLKDFGFRSDLSAASGALQAELAWTPRSVNSVRAWVAGLSGQLSLTLGAGRVQPGAHTEPAFALLAVPELLRDSSAAFGITDAQARPTLAFSGLTAEYQLHDGSAFTSNLHLDGDVEILMSGRIGLVAQDYDLDARILRGEERLPAPVRRFASVPRVAAVWMGLRDLLSAPARSDSRATLHLGGTWDAPVVRGGR
ncbi:MAG TPA: AsmA-like C-terminal region-containing protein [Steroidobacteraceae bacterium]|nr:AsmA-like C-terminal region-containing protein [Steroidobacteraceae bacterium]